MSTAEKAPRGDAGAATLAAAIALGPQIRAARDEIEHARRLPMPLVEAMKQAGIFRMPMPRKWGGPEIDPMMQVRIIEALAVEDASVGWCAMIGSDGGYFSAFLAESVAREMYRDLDAVTAGAVSVTGRAVRCKGGFRLSGRWPFASGIHHSTWLICGCMVYEGASPALRPAGVPLTRQCFVPTVDAQILDTWHTTGLRGSGSCDFTLEDYFVPEERSFDFENLKFSFDTPLYRHPFAFALNFPGPALGVARAAIDALIAAGTRPRRLSTIDGKLVSGELRGEEFVQEAVGRAEATLAAARAYSYATLEEMWDAVSAGRSIPGRVQAQIGMMGAQVYAMCTQAVETAYRARGGSAVYANNLLDRCLRDALTMNQHALNSTRAYAMAGRALLGLPVERYVF
ncbi:MAG TPA: acyl-CoA dehydrogenase family protein [Candidatus Binataceae bacterium]|nr:acyl-CoA dehydrogenase family protein [Candidatus Binataceae bacterium]